MIEYPVKIKFLYDKITGGGSSGGGSGGGVSVDKEAKAEQKKQTGGITKTVAQLGIIAAVLKALQSILEPLFDIINILVFVLFAGLLKGIDALVNGVKTLFTAEFWKSAGDWLLEQAGNLWEFVKGIFDKGLDVIKSIGTWIFDNVIVPAWNVLKDVGMWIWENVLLPAFQFLADVGKWIWENILSPAFKFLSEVGKWIWEQILKPAWSFLKDVGLWIWEQILKPAWNFLANVGMWIWEQILKPAWNFLKDIGKTIYDTILKPAFQKLADAISGAWNWIKSLFKGKSKSSDGTRAMGGLIPKDGNYFLHSGEVVTGGNGSSSVSNTSVNPVINITSNGKMGMREIDALARRLQQELNSFQRW